MPMSYIPDGREGASTQEEYNRMNIAAVPDEHVRLGVSSAGRVFHERQVVHQERASNYTIIVFNMNMEHIQVAACQPVTEYG